MSVRKEKRCWAAAHVLYGCRSMYHVTSRTDHKKRSVLLYIIPGILLFFVLLIKNGLRGLLTGKIVRYVCQLLVQYQEAHHTTVSKLHPLNPRTYYSSNGSVVRLRGLSAVWKNQDERAFLK